MTQQKLAEAVPYEHMVYLCGQGVTCLSAQRVIAYLTLPHTRAIRIYFRMLDPFATLQVTTTGIKH